MTAELIVRTAGPAGRLTLNRPEALNAVTMPMVRAMRAALDAWRNDERIAHVVLDAAPGKAFAAGGDLKSLYDSRPGGPAEDAAFHRTFWREEYELISAIHSYPKPFISLIDGIVMGGGVGVAVHGSHAVVTERAVVAMPECGIGLIPDVGGTYLLSRPTLVGEASEARRRAIGLFLGLTGQRMSAASAIAEGFATHHVASERLSGLLAALEAPGTTAGQALADFSSQPAGPPHAGLPLERIADAFSLPDVPTIIAHLERAGDAWSRTTLATLAEKSPLSLVVAHRAFAEGSLHRHLDRNLEMEYRLVSRCYEVGDFLEGIRAQVIDKDRRPRWLHRSPADIPDDLVDFMFSSLDTDDLML
ncbi:MAG: enoyl-CoA hydratase/isomerase family protein [Rhizobiales bacterium]|nr:enoyl-CoA hydratase/isomerase family protein [Hyphomicrobiales bacterium]